MRIIENATLVEPKRDKSGNVVEDWSRVRSPGRAARRRRQGHRQNITIVMVPMSVAYRIGTDTIVMHPEMARALREQISPRRDTALRDALVGGILSTGLF